MKKRMWRAVRTLLIICAGGTGALWAHPHVFIRTKVTFQWQKGVLQRAHITWEFDPFFSADIISGYDTNKDGLFDKKETQQVFENAFIHTKHYSFFTFIRSGESHARRARSQAARKSPQSVQHFSVSQKDGTLSYHFSIDLSSYQHAKSAPPGTRRTLYLALYDHSFFCDFRYAEHDTVRFVCDKARVQPSYEIVENRTAPVYYDPFDSIESTPQYEHWRPGLHTYYPKEILLRYTAP